MGLSALVITRNEERRRLAECLRGLAWADEVLVVDCGSTDGTVALARRHGARVLRHRWQGFGPQKNWGIERCRHEWVLSIDADEIITPALAEEIRRAINKPHTPDGFHLRISTHLGGRRIGCFEGLSLIRLFKKQSGRYDDQITDETVKVRGATAALEHPILHMGFDSYGEYLSKFNYYTTLEAAKHFPHRIEHPFSLGLASLMDGIKVFIKYYFVRLGMLDGVLGLFVATFSLLYPLAAFWKAWEMRKGWLDA